MLWTHPPSSFHRLPFQTYQAVTATVQRRGLAETVFYLISYVSTEREREGWGAQCCCCVFAPIVIDWTITWDRTKRIIRCQSTATRRTEQLIFDSMIHTHLSTFKFLLVVCCKLVYPLLLFSCCSAVIFVFFFFFCLFHCLCSRWTWLCTEYFCDLSISG